MSTHFRRRRLLQSAALVSALPVAWAQPKAAADAALNELLARRVQAEGVGLAAARFGASQVELGAAGPIRAGGEAIAPQRHAFEIGSITKPFVGVLLADAVLRQEVTLEQAVESLLPEGLRLRDSADAPLRLVDLATHRSGLPRLPDNLLPAQVPNPADPYAHYDDAALLAGVRQFKPTLPRDAQWGYSNFGFGLLAWVLARRAGLSLPDWFHQRLLAPLGLTGMQVATPGAAAPNAVQGHNPQGQAVPAWHFLALAGAGALRATAAELARFGQAAVGGFEHPLREAFALSLQTHSPLGPSPTARMGLGWMLAADGRLATHDGGTFGFSSSLWLNLPERRGALVLANAAVPVTDLARHLLDPSRPLRDPAAERAAIEANVRAAQSQSAMAMSAEALAPLAGVYALNPAFKITVRAQGTALFAQATGQGEFELFAKAERVFFARITPLEVTFDGASGPAPALVLRQGGQTLRFVRE